MRTQNLVATMMPPARHGMRSRSRSLLMTSVAIFAIGVAGRAAAQDSATLPSGGVVVGGSATIGAPSEGKLQIDQISDRTLINWNSFDIGSGAEVNFSQPGADAIALNRVIGGAAPSQIAGKLNSNGIVAVLNSNGVVFAGTADVNVGGLIASAGDVNDAAFMAGGPLGFTTSGASAAEIVIRADASIRIADQGLAAFFAPIVRNQGTISARLGHVTLASGSSATLDLDGTGFIEIGLGTDNALVQNSGAIAASGGTVRMTAKAASAVVDRVINTGDISVARATIEPDGTIVLSADTGNVRLGGRLDVGAAGTANIVATDGIDVAVDVAATGDLSLGADHVAGEGVINISGGALELALDVDGRDTSAEGDHIGDALGVVGTVDEGTRLNLGAGTYAAGARIDRDNVTIDGGGVATIRVPLTGAAINGLNIGADHVTVTGLNIEGTLPGGTAAWDYAWGGAITRGIAVLNGADDATITGNNIVGVRNGILVDGRGVTDLTIAGNMIDNSKSAISLQYVDGSASGFNIAGNGDGAFGNEWGIILHLNGVWDGTATTSGSGLLGADTSLDEQARLLALSEANGGIAVFNNGYTASNRTHVNVATAGNAGAQGAVPTPLDTIQAGIDAVVSGGTVTVQAGTYNGNVRIAKSGVSLVSAAGRDATIIQGQSGAGALGALQVVHADDVTIGGIGQGFTVIGIDNGQPGVENAAIYIQGDHSGTRVEGNRITAAGDYGLLSEYGATVEGFAVTGNIFDGKTYVGAAPGTGNQFSDPNVSRQLVVIGGDATANVSFTGNSVTGDSGFNTAVTIDTRGGIISNNSFASTTGGFGAMLRARGTDETDGSGTVLSDHETIIADNVFDMAKVGLTAHGILIRDDVLGGQQTSFADLLAGNDFVGPGAWSDISATGYHSFTRSIQAAINEAAAGAVISVRPGEYREGITGVDQFGNAGGQKFGLFVPTSNLTIRGVGANGNAITSADDVAAYVTALYQTGFGAQHFVSGSNVTIEGLGFKPFENGNNKTFEVIGDAFTMRNSVIDNRGNGTEINFYVSAFANPGAVVIESLTLEDNIFYGGTAATHGDTPSAMVKIGGGVGLSTDAANRTISGNRFVGQNLEGQGGLQVQGRIPAFAWQQAMTGAVTVTGNSFEGVDVPVRSVGILTEALAWNDIFRNNDNRFTDGGVLTFANDGRARGASVTDGSETYENIGIMTDIADAVAVASNGDTVEMLNGTYDLGGSPLVIDKSIALVGESRAGVVLDGRNVGASSGSNGLGTISVFADDVTLGNFTLYGSELPLGNYGIKVQPHPGGHVNTPGGGSERLHDFAISEVTIRGSRRAELDLNGVVGATITNVTADGRSLADPEVFTAGAGIQITDSANVTLAGVHTLGNGWGGVALYQSNKASGYSGQTANINIDASANQFDEALGLFSQRESATQGFGQLNLTGFGYAVRNSDHREDGLDDQFTFYRTSLADARDFALNVGTASASSIEGFANGYGTNIFTVAEGLSINAATRDARTGGTVNVGAGTFAETVSIAKGLTLNGAGIDATNITGGIQLSGTFSDLTLSNFSVSGSPGSAVIQGGRVTDLIVDGVRIDGGGAVGRHGFSGGQYGGDISITNSEFVNIKGWSAFDTRSGAGSASDGTQITSAVFSNNLIDNTVGHVAFRQQAGAGDYPDITIAGNLVRNGGDTDQSVGALFKLFRAGTVNFSGNSVSGVGVSGSKPAGEIAYGAVLTTRDVGTLNVTGNSFEDNYQVYAIEPGHGLPGTTHFSDNHFVNNGYAIYLPVDLAGAGTIDFGAGNDFVSGANTRQHIIWRSADALDLSNLSFGGVKAEALGLADLFALEDLITHGVDEEGAGLARLLGGQLFVTTASGIDGARRAAALAAAGDTLNLSSGTHELGDTLFLKQGITITGQGRNETIVDASGHNHYGIRVHGDDVTLSGFTLLGSSSEVGNSNYGIKVESGGDASARNSGFSISDVSIQGSRKTGLDINAAVGALIDGVIVSGVTAGNGISITDSAEVTVRNSRTWGNAWGGLALYQANNIGGGGSNQQLADVTIEANNDFAEPNGLYLQVSSALPTIGALDIRGYDFTVRNDAHRPDGAQFTYFQKGRQDAIDFGVNLAASDASVVQGWNGAGNDAHFHVGFGTLTDGARVALSLQAAFDASRDGDIIDVASGSYAQSASLDGARRLAFGDVTLEGLSLAGAGSSLSGSLLLDGGDFVADAPLTLNGDTVIRALAGDVIVAGATGNTMLTLAGDKVSLGAASLASLEVTGDTIVTAGVTTDGAQRYVGATILAGEYKATDFEVAGAAMLGGDVDVTAVGSARFGSVNNSAASPAKFRLDAGSAVLGAIGADSRLGATAVIAGETVLEGEHYVADSLSFAGRGSDASVRVVRSLTRFDTRASGGGISFAAHLIGTENGRQDIEVLAGTGSTNAANGSISFGNIGSETVRIGSLGVAGGDFSAATVKLAGDFVSLLSGNQSFTANTLDTLGNVRAVVAGNESGPIRAGGSVDVEAGGAGSGEIVAGGPVKLGYTGDVARSIISDDSVLLIAGGSVGGTIDAAGPVSVDASGAVSSNVRSGGSVSLASGEGISSVVVAGGSVDGHAATGEIGGSIEAGGPVTLAADKGSIISAISTSGTVSMAAGGKISGTVDAGDAVSMTASGAITGSISSGGAITLVSDAPLDVQVKGGAISVDAPGGTISGSFNSITTDDEGSFVVNEQPVVGSGKVDPRQIIVDQFVLPAGGTVGAGDEIILPEGFALGLLPPANKTGAARVAVVNTVAGIADLLRRGYKIIVIEIAESGPEIERELVTVAPPTEARSAGKSSQGDV